MLPGDGDATVDLGVEVGAEVGGRPGERGGDGGGVREDVSTGGGRLRCVPHGRGGELCGHGHVGAVVLHGLVSADDPTELQALLGIGGAHLRTRRGDADRLGGEQHAAEVHEELAGADEDRGGSTVEDDPGGATRGVEVLRDLDRDPATDLDDQHVVTAGDQQHLRQPAAEHDASVARGRRPVERDRGAERHSPGQRAVREAREQPSGLVLVPSRSDHGAGDDRRDEGPGRDSGSHRLRQDDQLLEAEARPPVGLGEMETEPSELGHLRPRRRELLRRCREKVPRTLRPSSSGEEVGRGLGQGEVVFGDGDGHGCS